MAGSLALYAAAEHLRTKGHFARAAEKLGAAAAAAVQELAAEDCLVVAYLRAAQADSLLYHSMAPTLTDAERDEARQTVKFVLLPDFMSTVASRHAADTLLPGSCRAAEVAWWRANTERMLRDQDLTGENARAGAAAVGPHFGYEAFTYACGILISTLRRPSPLTLSQELTTMYATLLITALFLVEKPRELPSAVMDGGGKAKFFSAGEKLLAQNMRRALNDELFSILEVNGEVASTIADVWRRIESSGVVAARKLGEDPNSIDMAAIFSAAAADAAVRGLRECTLAGCASKEVHVSQFKSCGACRAVAYCCREHQVADWPAHKAACKAARKQAADPET